MPAAPISTRPHGLTHVSEDGPIFGVPFAQERRGANLNLTLYTDKAHASNIAVLEMEYKHSLTQYGLLIVDSDEAGTKST